MPKAKFTKQKEAKERQEKYGTLSIKDKIARLDKKFGPDRGAAKERQKLAKQIEKGK